jgi:hypothetical protein
MICKRISSQASWPGEVEEDRTPIEPISPMPQKLSVWTGDRAWAERTASQNTQNRA